MRHFVVFLAAILWAVPVQAETKKAPDGFGPIKFGMTKEQAWAAIDGKGEWREKEDLDFESFSHRIELHVGLLRPQRFVANVTFMGSRVRSIDVAYDGEMEVKFLCHTMVAFVVGGIRQTYNQYPIESVLDQSLDQHFGAAYLYTFFFAGGTSISVTSLVGQDSDVCAFSVNYNHAQDTQFPF